ncbi:hypothetical protein MTO96_034072 [Rhipicephalus appendiculatus]
MNADDNRQSENSNTSPSERDGIGHDESANEDRSQGSPQSVIDDTAKEQLTESAGSGAGNGASCAPTAVGDDDLGKLFSKERLPNSDLSVADAVVTLMAYSTSGGLNWSDMEKLAHMMNILLGVAIIAVFT